MSTTRHSQRFRKFAPLGKYIDPESKQIRQQFRIDALESDFYESPNKLAEDENSDSFNANEEEQEEEDKKGRKLKKKKITKKVKVSAQVRKNLNLKKMLKEDNNVTLVPNFINIRASGNASRPVRKFCSICQLPANYTCPRCYEPYCSLECSNHHKEIQCLRAEF